MALTKVDTNIYTATNLTGSGSSTTSAWQDLQGSYGTQIHVKITNGTTLTVAAKWKIQGTSKDPSGVDADLTPYYQCTTINSDVQSWSVDIPIGVEFIRLVIQHATYSGNVSTIDAEYSRTTAI